MSAGMTEAISKQLSYVLRHRPDAIRDRAHEPSDVVAHRRQRAAGRAAAGEGAYLYLLGEAIGWPLTLHFVQLGVGLAIVNAICRLPPGVISRPVPGLLSTHYWVLGKPRTPAMEELARAIRLTVQHRRGARH